MIDTVVKCLDDKINITVFQLWKRLCNVVLLKNQNYYFKYITKNILLNNLFFKNIFFFNKLYLKYNVYNTLYFFNLIVKKKITSMVIFKKYYEINIFTYLYNNTIVKMQTYFIQKNTIHVFKKINKDISHELVLKDIPNNYHTKKFTNLNKTVNHKRIMEINKHAHNKKNKNISNKKSIKYYNNNNEQENQKIIYKSSKKNYSSKKGSILQQNFKKPTHIVSKNIEISNTITVCELANKMSIKASIVIKKMMKMGVVATINKCIDQDIAQLIIEEMGHKAILHRENALEELILQDCSIENDQYVKQIRPPIVTIMGHVDHGKTSLLDNIRSTRIALHESGGITQHIGAYHVKTNNGVITFLDTPGHAAFTAMRARGAQITDIVVLVVAGDDGVKPQTIEAIQHAKAANVPLLVAINKIDKVESNPDTVKKELMKYDILPEEWGGENIFVNVSSKTGEGINNLLNAILLQSEILELKAVYSGMASGTVIEAFLDKNRGPIATVLIRSGNLCKGDIILCGLEYGKIRLIRDAFGHELKTAQPSIPVQILGLSGIPISGDNFTVVKDEKKAREAALYRKDKVREMKLTNDKVLNLENMFENLTSTKNSELNIILKSDVQGSLEAILHAINNISNKDIMIKIISNNVGGITETDVSLAMASNAIIIGFNVRPNILAKRMIKIESVDVRYYSVIYNLIDDIKLAITGMLSPKYKEMIIGTAEVRNIFKTPQLISIAGSMVIDGMIKRNTCIHVLRNDIVIYKGELDSLRRFKEDVKEVGTGKECGIGIKKYNDIHIGDIIQAFDMIEIKRTF